MNKLNKIIKDIQDNQVSDKEAIHLLKEYQESEFLEKRNIILTETFYYGEPYLSDHLVLNEQVLLGVTYCSLAIKAIQPLFATKGRVNIHHLLFIERLVFKPAESVQIMVYADSETAPEHFTCSYKKLNELTEVVVAEGSYATTLSSSIPPINIQLLKDTSTIVIAGKEIYQSEKKEVIWHGASLHTIKAVYLHANASLAELHLSEEMCKTVDQYSIVHPALLDGAIVSALFSFANHHNLELNFIPLMIKTIQVFASVPAQCFCYAVIVKVNSEIIEVDCNLCNELGETLVRLEGFVCKRIRLEKESNQSIVSAIQTLSFSQVSGSLDNHALLTAIKKYLIDKLQAISRREVATISENKNFMDMGVDSVQLISLVGKLEEELDIKLYPTLFFEYQNLKDLAGFFANEHGQIFSQLLKFNEKKSTPIFVNDNIKTMENTSARTPLSFGSIIDIQDDQSRRIARAAVQDIAVIGMAGQLPQSTNFDFFWKHLNDKTDLISEIPLNHFDYRPWYSTDMQAKNKMYCKWGGFIEDVAQFDADFFGISPREAELMDPQLRLLLQTLYQTAEDAGCITEIKGSKTGNYVGVCFHDYAEEMTRSNKDVEPHDGTGNAATMLANRPSFYFDLKGPSLAIDTACSSSLFALHSACKALQRGECDMAFASGVNLVLSSQHYRYFCSLGALSPTGRCHTFDEQADGYVPGEAIASVLLKPLDKALADGDQIYGVIKGSATSHGGYTPSITAPSVEGEAAVLLSAWQDAGITPESLGYIEAHGTGTKLGDPVEVSALKKAFKQHTQKENFCAIGSAKAHVGHTEGAAGIVGVIKVLLSIKNKTIPAMPKFNKLNAYVHLDKSPFYINHERQDWKRLQDNLPLRAGVSSFGFGGAYAHVVVEEAPKRTLTTINKPYYIICLSGKTAKALKQREVDLLDWLNKASYAKTPLNVISYTLNKGRSHFNYRAAWVVDSKSSLKAMLELGLANKSNDQCFRGIFDTHTKPEDDAIHVKVLKNIFEELNQDVKHNTVYRENLSALANLYIKGYSIDWNALHQGESTQRISLPTYPFAKERYWVSESMVTKLSCQKMTAHLHSLVHSNTSDMSEQKFETLLTSDNFYIKDHVIAGNYVLPGVAHLEMVRAAGRLSVEGRQVLALENVVWSKLTTLDVESTKITIALYPEGQGLAFEIRSDSTTAGFIVHSQGLLILGDESHAPLEPVGSIEEIALRCPKKITSVDIYRFFFDCGYHHGPTFQTLEWLRVGKDEVLGKLQLNQASAHAIDRDHYYLHPFLLDGALHAVCGFTMFDRKIELQIPFSLDRITLVKALPDNCYVHVKRGKSSQFLSRYNIDLIDGAGEIYVQLTGFTFRALKSGFEEGPTLNYYEPQWMKMALENPVKLSGDKSSLPFNTLLIFSNDTKKVAILKQALAVKKRGIILVQVELGKSYQQHTLNHYTITMSQSDDYAQLFNDLAKAYPAAKWKHIVDFWKRDAIELTQQINSGSLHLLVLTQTLLARKIPAVRLLHFYDDVEGVFAPSEMHTGFAKSLQQEHANYIYQVIGLRDADKKVKQFVQIIVDEFSCEGEAQIRYIEDQRWIHGLASVDFNKFELLSSTMAFKAGGVYLITGGLGGLGLIFANYLAQHYQAKLILTGRSPLDKKRRALLDSIEACESEVLYIAADICEREDVQYILKTGQDKFGELNGIIHVAGILHDSLIINKTQDEMQAVLAPKVQGVMYLDELTQTNKALDCFIVFSSIAGVLGNAGQSDYASANAFMDSFVNYRDRLQMQGKRYGKAISINWPLWQDGGMQVDEVTQKYLLASMGMELLCTKKGLEAFVCILQSGHTQVLPLYGQRSRIESILFRKEVRKTAITTDAIDNNDLREQVMLHMQAQAHQVLKLPINTIDESADLTNYGFDSINLTEFATAVNKAYGFRLTPPIFFEYPTLASFVDYLIACHQEDVMKVHKPLMSMERRMPQQESFMTEQHAPFYQLTSHRLRFTKQMEGLQSLSHQKSLVNDRHDIAVIGMSGVFPEANNLAEFWKNLSEGKDCIHGFPENRPELNRDIDIPRWGGFIDDIDKFDAAFFTLSPREAELMDPQQRIFLEAVWQLFAMRSRMLVTVLTS